MDPLILHNDRILPLAEARLSPGQAGLLLGWGVFTTLRIYRGRPFEFHRHWERMTRDAARLDVEVPCGEDLVLSRIVELARANRRVEGAGRVSFVKNYGGLWSGDPGGPVTDLLVFTRELSAWPESHRLLLQQNAAFSAGVLAGAKMLSWAQNTLLLEKARAQGYDDALLLNDRGEITECTSANFFMIRAGEGLTPPLASGCLPGVTREVLFPIAARAGIALREQALMPADLASADEVFISSTTREVAGVGFVSPDLRFAAPGAVTRKLEAAFRQYVEANLGSA
ncbi:MAG TPA: aminotransferase class IV [Terriglobia bacterium]|nr:aminotransferase class IV [Terriglobia bacterium]